MFRPPLSYPLAAKVNVMARHFLKRTAVFACLLAPALASAQDWAVDKQHSQVGIVTKGAATANLGTVNQWDSHIVFDPNRLDMSSVVVNVDVGSIRMNDPRWNALLPQNSWLAPQAFPNASFTSTAITHVGGNAYEAAGTLTIRGVRQNVSLPFTVDLGEGVAHARGELRLLRTDFGIGGLTNDTPDFGITVGVTFDLTATK